VLRSIASKIEQIAETNIVNIKARKNIVIILWVGNIEFQRFYLFKKILFNKIKTLNYNKFYYIIPNENF
jgi:hypothetical protein